MFDNLSDRLAGAAKSLTGKGRITDDNIKDTVRQIRMALLEADVALPVVKDFVAQVRERAQGQEVVKSLKPGQAFVKIVHDELTQLMGEANESLDLSAQPPAVVMLAGLQGAGKTTSAAKLAKHLLESGKKVSLVSVDVHRPAAILQLERLASEVGAHYFPSQASEKPVTIAKNALAEAKRSAMDVLIVDTAGRLHIDESMMGEVQQVHAQIDPVETLFVVDSMAGQDAVVAAKAFDAALPLTGVVLTKVDGDARGGAALSVRHVTGKPIKFLGVGEKTDALEAFHPERVASRILGMGDVVTLVEEVQQKVDQDKAQKLAKKLKKGKGFDMNDLKDQLGQMLDMGGLSSLLDKLPGGANLGAAAQQVDDKDIKRQIAIINSMTPRERRFPKVIDGSRKRRIAAGAGLQVQDVNRMLKQFTQMQKMMKKMAKGGLSKMMRGLSPKMMGPRFR